MIFAHKVVLPVIIGSLACVLGLALPPTLSIADELSRFHLQHMEEHFDYWNRCSDTRYELERRLSYCKSILADGRHDQREVQTEIGDAYLRARRYGDAATALAAALGHDRSFDPYIAGLPAQAEAEMDEALVLTGQYDKALADANQAIKDHPDANTSYNLRCRVNAVSGKDLESALTDCEKASKLHDNAEAHDLSGLVDFKLGKLKDAELEINEALDQDSKLASSLYMRGVIELQNGDSDTANDDIEAAKKRDPGIAERFVDYGVKP